MVQQAIRRFSMASNTAEYALQCMRNELVSIVVHPNRHSIAACAHNMPHPQELPVAQQNTAHTAFRLRLEPEALADPAA